MMRIAKLSAAVVLMLMALSVSAGNNKGNNIQDCKNMKAQEFNQIFPLGDKLPEMYSKYFVGQAYLAPLTQNKELSCPISNVTFEPGCRNSWHSHTGGQVLVVTAGKGYYQEKGEAARLLQPGDVVEIAPNVVHWHGAAPDSWFSHLAIEANPQTNKNTWYEPVSDEEYKKLK